MNGQSQNFESKFLERSITRADIRTASSQASSHFLQFLWESELQVTFSLDATT